MHPVTCDLLPWTPDCRLCCCPRQVPVENVLGGENNGVAVLMSGLDYERLVLSAGPVGLMQAALDVALPYATQRKQFGTAIGNFQVCVGRQSVPCTALRYSYACLSHCVVDGVISCLPLGCCAH